MRMQPQTKSRTHLLVLSFLVSAMQAFGESDPIPASESAKTNPPRAKITVALPEPEGTLSIGIFNSAGKIVKPLTSEKEISSLKSTLNGIELFWDYTGEKGLPVSGSNYRAKGFLVSDLNAQGEAFHGNDWATDPDPKRPTTIIGLHFQDGAFVASFKDPAGQSFAVSYPISSDKPQTIPSAPNEPPADQAPTPRPTPIPKTELKTEASAMDSTQWHIEGGKALLKTLDGTPLRQIKNLPSEPTPIAVAAAPDAPIVGLVEQSKDRTRLRILRFRPLPGEKWKPLIDPVTKAATTDTGVNIWQTLVEHQMQNCDSQASASKWLPILKKAPSSGRIKVPLTPSAIDNDQKPTAEVVASFDQEGLQLRSADGLLIRSITSTTGIRWACLAMPTNDRTRLLMFQSDGAVIEEFSIPLPLAAIPLDAGTFSPPAQQKK